jgi:hypothetical protein
MRLFVRMLLAIGMLSVHAFSQSWYTGEASAVGGEDVPIARLRQQALTQARVKALEQAGVSIQSTAVSVKSESGRNYIDMYGAFAQSSALGIIAEEKNVNVTTDVSTENGITLVRVKVSLEARITVPEGKPDYTFIVGLKTSKEVYRAGDYLQLSIESSQDGYLTLFQIRNDTCYILHPHPLLPVTRNNRIKARSTVEIPPRNKPYSFELNLEGGDGKTVTEVIVAVVTKDDYPIGGSENVKEYFSMQEYSSWLLSIPLDKRTASSAVVNIVKK